VRNEPLGQHLRQLREDAGLDPTEVEHLTGVRPRRLKAIEAGAANTTFVEAMDLAHLYGTTVGDIFASLVGQSMDPERAASVRLLLLEAEGKPSPGWIARPRRPDGGT
jgi:DNA-binding XRE family transcriptional regulator